MRTAVLTSSRLTLDSISASDAAAVFEYCQDPDIQRYTRVPLPYERNHAEYFTEVYATEAASGAALCLWAVRSNSQLVGTAELRFDSAELGYWIGQPFRGQGLMTEALGMIVSHALDPAGFDLERVTWEAVVGNTASATVVQRNGFTFDESPAYFDLRGQRHDAWRASLHRSDSREPKLGWPL